MGGSIRADWYEFPDMFICGGADAGGRGGNEPGNEGGGPIPIIGGIPGIPGGIGGMGGIEGIGGRPSIGG